MKFGYDWNGNLKSIVSPTSDSLLYSYDRELPTRVDMRGVINGSVSVRYDNDFKVVSQTINDVDSIQYTYDNDGLLTQLGDLQITRDSSNGRVTSTQIGNIETDYVYSNTGELASVDNSVNGSSTYSTNYTRDSLGRISILTETIEGVTNTKRYTYDVAGRLSEVYNNNSLTAKYYYDSNGNRDSVVTPNGTTYGVYDAQDRMLQYACPPSFGRGNANYVYTRNGDLSLKIEPAAGGEGSDTTKYVYDDFGNLMSVTLPNNTKIEYIIDGQNRRVGRKVNGIVKNRWIYSGQLHPIAEIDSAGNIIATYHAGYMQRGDTAYRIIRDHLGSVRMVMNAQTGEVVQRMDYDEYGNVTFDSNPGFQPFSYAGGLYDSQTKLIRFGARDYDALVGRWISTDPIKFLGGLSNLFEYCACDPINNSDENGLQWIVVTIRYNDGPYGSETYIITPGMNPIDSYNTNTVGDNGKELDEGVYIYEVGQHPLYPTEDQTPYEALNLYSLDGDRDLPATQNGCPSDINGLNVHRGNKKGSSKGTGSKGCHVVQPKDWNRFINNFNPGGGGFYIYKRAR